MADIAAQFSLVTPGGTILFNDQVFGSATNQYLITSILGLDGTPIRAPIDDMPFGHGALWHNWWESGRSMLFDGIFLIQSTRIMNSILAIRNVMEENLRVALRSIAADVTSLGTLTWTPYGLSPRVLTVRNNITVEYGEIDNYLNKSFHFGLFAADPDWDGWSS